MSNFYRELISLINKYGKEKDSNTPDFVLAQFLDGCLHSFNLAQRRTEHWRNPPNVDICAKCMEEVHKSRHAPDFILVSGVFWHSACYGTAKIGALPKNSIKGMCD